MDLTLTNALIGAAATIAAAVVGLVPYLLKRRSQHEHRAKPSASGQPLLIRRDSRATDPSPSPRAAVTSFEEYNRVLRNFGDRFLERDEFERAIVGKRIDWCGYVVSVHSGPVGRVNVHFRPSVGANAYELVAAANFGAEWKAKLFSLRSGDNVRIRGIAHGGLSPFMIDGETIDLLAAERE